MHGEDGATGLHGEDGAEGLHGDVNGDLVAEAQPLETSTRTCGSWGEGGEREGEVHVERCTTEPKRAAGRVGQTGWQAEPPSHPGAATVRPRVRALLTLAPAVCCLHCTCTAGLPQPAGQGEGQAQPQLASHGEPGMRGLCAGVCTVQWCVVQSWGAPSGHMAPLPKMGRAFWPQHEKGRTVLLLEKKEPNITSNSNQGHCVHWSQSYPA